MAGWRGVVPLNNQYKVKYYYEAINTGTIFIDYMMLSQHGANVLRGVTRVHHSYSILGDMSSYLQESGVVYL